MKLHFLPVHILKLKRRMLYHDRILYPTYGTYDWFSFQVYEQATFIIWHDIYHLYFDQLHSYYRERPRRERLRSPPVTRSCNSSVDPPGFRAFNTLLRAWICRRRTRHIRRRELWYRRLMNFIWLVALGAARRGSARWRERASELNERTGAQITTGARRAGNLIGLNYCLGSSAAPSIID